MTAPITRQDVRGVTPTRRAVAWWTALVIACACPVTHAATRTWTGLGADDKWTTGGNWSVALVANDTPQFEGSTRLTPFNDFAAGTSFIGILFSSSATGSFTVSGNSITLTGNVTNSSSSALTQTVNLDLVLSGATRTISSSTSGNTVINGAISGSQALNLSMGGGTVVLAGNNSHTGVTTITNSGIYTLSGDNSAMTGGVTINSSVATLRINHAGALGTGTFNYALGGTIDNTSGGAITLSTNPAIAASATLNFTGSNALNMGTGTLTLSASRTFNVNGSTLTFGGAVTGTNTNITKGGAGTLVFDNTLSIGNAQIIVNAGTLRLNAASNHTSSTIVSGVLIAAANDALGTTATGTVVNAGGTLKLENVNYTTTEGLTINGAGAAGQNGALVSNGTTTYAGLVVIGSTDAVISVDSGTLNLSNTGTTTGTGRLLTLTGAGQGTYASVIGTSAAGTLTKSGTGTWRLTNANTYGGVTTVSNGVLRLGHANALPGGIGATGGTSNLTLAGGVVGLETGNFLRNLGTGVTAVQFTGSGGFAAYTNDRSVNFNNAGGTVTWASGSFVPNGSNLILGATDADKTVTFVNPINFNGATRTIDVRDGSAAVDGVLSGALSNGGLEKAGAGTLLLSSSANTYSGATLVNQGTLLVSGSIASSSGVTVSAGTTLGGTGVVSTISGAGLVAPGNSPGILTASSVNPSGGMDWAFEFTATGSPTYNAPLASVNDVLHLTGATPFSSLNLTAANVVNVYLGVATLTSGDTFRGAFFTDVGDFTTTIVGGSYNYYVLGDGAGTHVYNGVGYYTLAEFSPIWNASVSMVLEPTAAFNTGTVNNGFVTQFTFTETLIPEPSSAALALLCVVMLRIRRGRGC